MSTVYSFLTRTMLVAVLAWPACLCAQSGLGVISGTVADPSGAMVPAAIVSVVSTAGKIVSTRTNNHGQLNVLSLTPGKYVLKVTAPGFEVFTQNIEVTAGQTSKIDVRLVIAKIETKVDVKQDSDRGDTDSAANTGTIVIKEKALETLSEDPDELKLQLQALAGAAPGGVPGQIYVDGFSGGRLPPKSAIREIRINQDPFSAEYEQPGFGRIEIFTKPGAAQFRGLFSFRFNHSIFNAGSPFSTANPSYHSTLFSSDLGGPLTSRSSFEFDLDRNSIQDDSVIQAVILGPNLNPLPLTQAVPNPKLRTIASLRVDYQVNQKNTFFARYQFYRDKEKNDAVGQLSLQSQAFDLLRTEHTLQLSNTTIVNTRIVNESRFEYRQVGVNQVSLSSEPQISVTGAFIDGGNSIGKSFIRQNNYQIQNYTSIDRGKHFFKFGGQLRLADETDASTGNFNGGFIFPSLLAFQITQQGLQSGRTPAQIRAAGGGAAQFSMTRGQPSVSNTMIDAGMFLLDNWKLRKNVTLDYGLRYEIQNQIADNLDLVPRAGLAWGIHPGKTAASKTILRLGAGIFYTRFSQSLVLNSLRLNGSKQEQFLVQNPDFFPAVPSPEVLAAALVKPTIYQIDPSLRAPFMLQTSISIERKLPMSTSLAVTYLNSNGRRQLLSRNINAPLPGTYDPADSASGVRLFPDAGNIYEYESRGRFQQNQITAGLRIDGLSQARLTANYTLNFAKSNTAGASSFPSNQFNIDQDYGRADYDIRHQFNFGGQIDLPLGAYINPFLIFSSGYPYNITVGRDLNGDSIFNDRPAYATDLSRPTVIPTRFGLLDTAPSPGAEVVPPNLATGRSRFTLNLRLVKAFSLGNKEITPVTQEESNQKKKSIYRAAWQPMYAIRFEIIANNIFNRTNFATPIGSLSSPFFGKSIALAGSPFSTASSTRQIIFRTVFRF